MSEKKFPVSREQTEKILQRWPTPFHIYDEKAIRDNARALRNAFSWAPGFKEFFAVKATPNPFLIKMLAAEGFGVDCSSLAELELARRIDITGEEIIFSSNDTPALEYQRARELGALINLDDITHLSYLEEHAGLPDFLSFRLNPGPLKEGNVIIGRPEEAKYGLTRKQMFEAYRIARDKGVKRFGIHTMVASNELDPSYFIETADILFSLIAEVRRELDISVEVANIGGGIGVAYHPDQQPVDLETVSAGIQRRYESIVVQGGLSPVKLAMECGRAITGPYGYLVARVLHKKNTYKQYAGLDANMAHLMRPAIYGAYHHISVLGKESLPRDQVYDVTGSLCENNDKFAIDRPLPALERGDIVVIHDAGAHGHAMGFNYNGKLRSAELLLRENGEVLEIRRAETLDDYFATLDFEAASRFRP
jgi:diaminopimelate decarboxylase